MIKFAKKFYITTTIPYANAPPHVGFALEIVQADVLARWNKLHGKDVFFLTGTDEHGVKNYQAAKKLGLTPQKFVDNNSAHFRKLTEVLNISNTNFIRTTDKKAHWQGVLNIWKILAKKKDIYKKKYTGSYCQGCERFITDKDLVSGKCPNHPNLEIEKISEENYFFKLSKYSNKIRELIKKDKLRIFPEQWKNDFLALTEEGLTDVSFSREKKHLPWGIPVPGDENQVMYVWCDALTNYLTGIGYPDKKYKKYWPADTHVVGKDMLRFHAGIWPGMLLSAGLPLPKEIIVHGFLTSDGQKMSKSLGNVVEPIALTKKYSSDSIRYFFCRNFVFGEDGDFSEKALAERYNGELANKLGNLVSRLATLAEKYGIQKTENKLVKKLKLKEIEKLIASYSFDKALNLIFAFVDECNQYIQEKKPWETHNKKVLYEVADSLKAITILLWPFIPDTCEKISKQFGFKLAFSEIKKPLKTGKIKVQDILFKKIDLEKAEIVEPFEKLDLRVAEIKKVEDIEGADKLYKIQIDVGQYGKRQIVAGIKMHYSKDELKGKKIVIVANLKPAKLRGENSEGMLLAGEHEGKVGVLTAPKSKPGDSVFPHGITIKPAKQIEYEEFAQIKLEGKDGSPYYKGKILQTINEEIKIEKIKGPAIIR